MSKIKDGIENWVTAQALRETMTDLTLTLVESLNFRDEYTAGHSIWVSAFAVETGRILGLHPSELEILRSAGVLHDLGKIGVRDGILSKPAG